MILATMGAGLIVLTCCGAYGQAAGGRPEFEVASVKPAAPITDGRIRVQMSGGPGTPDPGRLNWSNVTLKNVLMRAYEVKSYQISGPGWLDSERFDIVAKIPYGTNKEQFELMLQALLEERFRLTLHREKKDLPMYALVVGKNGPKLKESVDDPVTKDADGPAAAGAPSPGGGPLAEAAMARIKVGSDGVPKLPAGAGRGAMMIMMGGNGRFRMQANGQSVAQLADMLSMQLDRPVVDMTELKAKYDITLDFAPEEGSGMGMKIAMLGAPPMAHAGGGEGAPPVATTPDGQSGPSIFAALQEQLGLKLEAKKGPVDLLVIDRLEKVPTEN